MRVNDRRWQSDPDGNHTLHRLAISGDMVRLQELLSKSRDTFLQYINLPNALGEVPLHLAIQCYGSGYFQGFSSSYLT